jgi:acetylornithine deacetylase
MKMNLPPFIEIYRALIATPSISATEEALDQSNESLINLLAGWFSDLGFNVEVQPVPGTRHKFNLLASTGTGAGGLLLPVIPIPCRLTMAAGRAIRSP